MRFERDWLLRVADIVLALEPYLETLIHWDPALVCDTAPSVRADFSLALRVVLGAAMLVRIYRHWVKEPPST